jgi:hypothetical protein
MNIIKECFHIVWYCFWLTIAITCVIGCVFCPCCAYIVNVENEAKIKE